MYGFAWGLTRIATVAAVALGWSPVGHAGTSAAVTTTTKITASATSGSYDSWVTFTAKVTAKSGTPSGAVVFADASNGSLLGEETLHKGTASLSTAALAPGNRGIEAMYVGSSADQASHSAPLAFPVAAAGSDAVAYQIDPHHDGRQAQGTALSPSTLKRKWSRTLGTTGSEPEDGAVSYPVIAGGRVFVLVQNSGTSGSVLYALNASTGTTDWSAGISSTFGFAALAYDGRRLFVLSDDGQLTAFIASSGHQAWTMQLPGQSQFTAPPTAYDGVVYAAGSGEGGTLYAVSETGVLWGGVPLISGDKSSPAVDNSGIYLSYACQQDYRFSLLGKQIWHVQGNCEGGGGSTGVYNGKAFYARGSHDTPLILSRSSGSQLGTFASQTAPAFGSTSMFTLQSGNLVAVDPSGSPNLWTFGDGSLVTAPVVSGGTVYEGSSNGTVYGLKAGSGAKVFSSKAGPEILGPDEQNDDILAGLAIGGGLLAVPAGPVLTVYGN